MCELSYTIENRGIEKGMEKGREEGERLATFRTAKKFKDNNVDINIIINSTGLTREQVEEL